MKSRIDQRKLVFNAPDKPYLTPNEVASLFMVSPITVRQWAQKGLLKAEVTVGGHRRFLRGEVERFAREHRLAGTRADSEPGRARPAGAHDAGPTTTRPVSQSTVIARFPSVAARTTLPPVDVPLGKKSRPCSPNPSSASVVPLGSSGTTLGPVTVTISPVRIAVLRSAAVHLAAQRATQERDSLISLAHTDPLTGLLNRRGLNDMLRAALMSSTRDRMLAVFVIDLDEFKPVNDQYGHDVGDELLMVVAQRLRATMRANDAVARVGGDEFVIMAAGLHSEAQARELGNKLLDALRTPFSLGTLGARTCRIGGTIGYALAPQDGMDAAQLLKTADAAMYAGKQAGKNALRRGAAVAA